MVAAGLVTRAGIAHVVEVLALGVPVVALWSFARAREVWARAYDRERRGREEMEAYARLDTRLARDGDIRGLAERVCGVVASRSPFCRVAMLARDADGRLYVAARVGMALETVAAVETWAAGVVERERGGERGLAGQMQLGAMRLGAASVVIALPDAAGECRGVCVGLFPPENRRA